MGFTLQSGAHFLSPLSAAILCYENTLFSRTASLTESSGPSQVINWEDLDFCRAHPQAGRGANPTPKDVFHSSFTSLTSASWMHIGSFCDRAGLRLGKCGFVDLLIPRCI